MSGTPQEFGAGQPLTESDDVLATANRPLTAKSSRTALLSDVPGNFYVMPHRVRELVLDSYHTCYYSSLLFRVTSSTSFIDAARENEKRETESTSSAVPPVRIPYAVLLVLFCCSHWRHHYDCFSARPVCYWRFCALNGLPS